MKATMQTSKRLACIVGFVLLALCTIRVWNKHAFCQGWAEHYAARANQFRSDAANRALRQDEARNYLIAADTHDLISRKYSAVASRPWHQYPKHPLITPAEQRIIEARR
jgi:hypothetical protein